MTTEAPAAASKIEHWRRRMSLGTGCVLFLFLITHLLNHTLGLASLSAMDAGRYWFLGFWRSGPGTLLFYGSLILHTALAMYGIYNRRSLRMPLWEAAQIVLGMSIPLFMISHVVGTRLAHELFGTLDTYERLMYLYWERSPDVGLKQTIFLLIAWTHACVGLHYWLRLKPWYSKWFPACLSVMVLIAALSLGGFSQGGREAARLSADAEWRRGMLRSTGMPDRAQRGQLHLARDALWWGYLGLVALVLLARGARCARERMRKTFRVAYAGGREAVAPVGSTVLEASRAAGVPHASVCGGRGRCSTCRVKLLGGADALPSAQPEEQRVLERIKAAPDVRLACQLRPGADLSVLLMLPAGADAAQGFAQRGYASGQERGVAVLFADLRGFTRIAEKKLPYDVVFFLNCYFDVMGEAITQEGGLINQFVGDGVMALFGVEEGPEEGCRQALAAACAIVDALDGMSKTLADELEEPLRVGVGIHTGPTVVGHMGRGVAKYLTAVGDTVNAASRLQDLTKEYGCKLVISAQVAERAGADVSAFPAHQIEVRNRAAPLTIRAIENPRDVVLGRGNDSHRRFHLLT